MFLYSLFILEFFLFFIVAVSWRWAKFLVFFFFLFSKISPPPLPQSVILWFHSGVIKDCRTAAGMHKITSFCLPEN